MVGQSQNSDERSERIFRGIPVAPGIAHGEALVHWLEEEEIPLRKITPEELPGEIARFEAALIATRAELLEIQQRIAASIGTHDASIFDAHLLVVEDRTLIDEVLRSLEDNSYGIECTFHRVAEKYCRTLQEIDDPYLRERVVDIEDVSRRVLRHLLGKASDAPAEHDKPHIIITHDLTPSDTAQMNRTMVLGFATEAGSKTSHTAIMARALDIPAIVGLGKFSSEISSGDDVLLDGYSGTLIVNPSLSTLEKYGRIELQKEEVEERLELIRDTLSATTDGRHIVLSANVELAEELDDISEVGAEGIGLYRTEFLFLNRTRPPDEEEQYANYRLVAEKALPHAVIIRTLDIGGDKTVESLDLPSEQNPFLGCRAIRFCLQRPEIFKPQLRAILRAGAHGNVKIMLPMISGVDELRQARAILDECRTELDREKKEFNPDVQIGTMIEIPSAALSARALAREVDFFSIGTNDLIQYTLAIDRVNEHVAHLYQPTHPAILQLVQVTADAAHDAGIWCGICGETAGDIALTPLLLGLGVDELSTSPSLVPRVKKAVQSLGFGECQALAMEAIGLDEHAKILKLSESLARERYGELF
jgi:phosphoenolpyruvate-protein phosphotransferase (PTS system enzyme I)